MMKIPRALFECFIDAVYWALITVPATPKGLFHQAKEQKPLSHKAIEKS